MRKKRLFWQLYISNVFIIFLALLAFTLVLSRSFTALMFEQVSGSLISRAELVRREVRTLLLRHDERAIASLCITLGKSAETRITVVAPDGRVLGDSNRDPHGMEGTSIRFSATLQQNTMYAAIPIWYDGRVIGVLRTAVPVSTVETAVARIQWQIAFGGLVLVLFAGLVSYWISRRITRPVNDLKRGALRFAEGDLAFRLPEQSSEELNDLASVMNQMAMLLEDRIRIITQQHYEQDAILAGMVEGVLVFDMDERLLNLNASAARLLRVDPDRVRGKSIQEVVRNVGLQNFVRESLQSEAPTEGYITLFEKQERHLQVHGGVLRDAQSQPIGLLIVLNDVTDLRALENVRRDFVANVSHELKTPITSIKGFVETLQDGALEDKADTDRFLGIISKQADRLSAIIEDLLSLSRIESGTDAEEIPLQPDAISPVLHSAVQVCSMDALARGISVQVLCRDEIRAMINPQLLEQAVVNLINNAIKYSESGDVIEVGCRVAGDEIVLDVRDQGCGIEAEHLPRLFERFYRVDKARSRKLGGTGLGLAIVKHIAQAHHGSVQVQSTTGEGSVFSIHLQNVEPVNNPSLNAPNGASRSTQQGEQEKSPASDETGGDT